MPVFHFSVSSSNMYGMECYRLNSENILKHCSSATAQIGIRHHFSITFWKNMSNLLKYYVEGMRISNVDVGPHSNLRHMPYCLYLGILSYQNGYIWVEI